MYNELAPRFEKKLLTVASQSIRDEDRDESTTAASVHFSITHPSGQEAEEYYSTQNYSLLVSMDPVTIEEWQAGYKKDAYFSAIIANLQAESHANHPLHPKYHYSDDGMLYFEDWNGNNRLCVPTSQQVAVMSEVHNSYMEAAHAGYHRCYNRLAASHYWPKMSRDLKQYINTCSICQKAKLCIHSPTGMLQPIPIPSCPFEVVSMDFILELPLLNSYNNILVIIDKLTKWAIFIPCSTKITNIKMAELFFKHVICKYGIPSHIITDCDSCWWNSF